MKLADLYLKSEHLSDEENAKKNEIDELLSDIRKNKNQIKLWPVSKICYRAHTDLFRAFDVFVDKKEEVNETTLYWYTVQDTIDVLTYILQSRNTWKDTLQKENKWDAEQKSELPKTDQTKIKSSKKAVAA